MTKTRLISLFVLFLAACHPPKSDNPPPGGGDGQDPTPGPQPTLTVHAPDHLIATLQLYRSVHVLLGDGSRFRETLDGSGVVRFQDPAIVGPQDVSLLMVGTTGEVSVETFLALEGSEIWLPNELFPQGVIPWTRQGTLSGRVTGATNPSALSVSVVGKGLSGVATPAEDGTYSINVRGEEPGRVDLFARETGGDDNRVVRVGLKRDIAVSAETITHGLDFALDHLVDQSLHVTVEGGRQGTEASALLTHYLDGEGLFSTHAVGTPPLSVPTIARTAPFETITSMLRVLAGNTTDFPEGAVQTDMPVGPTSTTVTLPQPLNITSPSLGPQEAPASDSLSGLVLRWNHDGAAHRVKLELAPRSWPGTLKWSVMAPPSITSFKPFPLPANLAPVTTFPAGSYEVFATTTQRADVRGYADFFTGKLPVYPPVETRTTRRLAYVELR